MTRASPGLRLTQYILAQIPRITRTFLGSVEERPAVQRAWTQVRAEPSGKTSRVIVTRPFRASRRAVTISARLYRAAETVTRASPGLRLTKYRIAPGSAPRNPGAKDRAAGLTGPRRRAAGLSRAGPGSGPVRSHRPAAVAPISGLKSAPGSLGGPVWPRPAPASAERGLWSTGARAGLGDRPRQKTREPCELPRNQQGRRTTGGRRWERN